MNDRQFELLEHTKDDITIEEALFYHAHGICVVCEDGKAARFEFDQDPEYKICG